MIQYRLQASVYHRYNKHRAPWQLCVTSICPASPFILFTPALLSTDKQAALWGEGRSSSFWRIVCTRLSKKTHHLVPGQTALNFQHTRRGLLSASASDSLHQCPFVLRSVITSSSSCSSRCVFVVCYPYAPYKITVLLRHFPLCASLHSCGFECSSSFSLVAARKERKRLYLSLSRR